MIVDENAVVSSIADAIGEPARARMLYSLMDGHARTSTELAVVAEVSPSTASVHLSRLKDERLVNVVAQGKHRYYSIANANVAAALEALSVLAGGPRQRFVPTTPSRLRAARTCYDHLAGTIGVLLHDRFIALSWLEPAGRVKDYAITPAGERALDALGIDVDGLRRQRRRLAFGCLDWSERRPHLGGALAADVLRIALQRRWLRQDLDSRALTVTALGARELQKRFGIRVTSSRQAA
ncbi:MAG TPA: helix-turn-helix transcriptional regulator [Vicinamibacterales bacterium]|jgi:DNA-binding transcriptional ArsR family regulator